MQTVKNGDVVLHVRDEGPRDGRVVMFANSLGTDLRVWDSLIPLLPDGLRIVRFDKRGHGLSDGKPAPYDLDLLVSDAETVCAALGLTSITFVGLSIGGLIGQALAAKRPDLLRGLVLMDTAAKIGDRQMWQERIDVIRDGGIEALADAVMQRWFAPSFHRDRADELSIWRNMLCRTTVEGYVGCCEAIASADLTETTRALTLPIMAICGAEDGATPPDLVRKTAELCSAPFHVIEDTAHIPCIERPAAVADLIRGFLEGTVDVQAS